MTLQAILFSLATLSLLDGIFHFIKSWWFTKLYRELGSSYPTLFSFLLGEGIIKGTQFQKWWFGRWYLLRERLLGVADTLLCICIVGVFIYLNSTPYKAYLYVPV